MTINDVVDLLCEMDREELQAMVGRLEVPVGRLHYGSVLVAPIRHGVESKNLRSCACLSRMMAHRSVKMRSRSCQNSSSVVGQSVASGGLYRLPNPLHAAHARTQLLASWIHSALRANPLHTLWGTTWSTAIWSQFVYGSTRLMPQ